MADADVREQHDAAADMGGNPGSEPDADTARVDNDANVGPTPPAASSGSASLESLAPRYDEAQHDTYLRHLEEALKDPRNRNIAVTGRYGTGKSSVLDEFERNHQKKALRLAIATLGPDSEGGDLTNRIQKELVKQLLYRAAPGQLRHSPFNRITPLSTARAALEAAGTIVVLGLLLWLLGWLPPVAGTGTDQDLAMRVAAWVVVGVPVVAVATVLRLVTYGRFTISNVSAAGTSVALTEQPSTYFDKYLDAIVYFFDEVSPDVVIFEDLDRFDDPHIFEALRELNTLLNNTSKRRKKGEPLRFVYAIKDSLFERLGTDTKETDDAAAAETVRANRTKFFDVVIPLVPFISHRNARELLTRVLDEARITDIDRRLVELVSQHATDMRLLWNMRNEYLVFAERLLASGKPAPGLTPSNLFALVAYKNFHLEDFEQISRRSSGLDHLYDARRDLVRSAIADCEKRKRDLADSCARAHAMTDVAEELGARLWVLGEAVKAGSNYASWRHLRFLVDSKEYTADRVTSPDFWTSVAKAGEVAALASSHPDTAGQRQRLITLERSHLEHLLPEALEANRWDEIDQEEVRATIEDLNNDITFLRGADFNQLAGDGRFTTSIEDGEQTFSHVVDATMKSDLARDLVKRGYLDRNFALYAAQFYGHFTGVDVATFIVQSVQTNTMDIDYTFDSPGAIENLLQEAHEDFTRTVSAYNIDVLDYLLGHRDERAANVVDHMVTNFGDETKMVLTAYLNSGNQRPRLAARLSRHPWRDVFFYLITDEGVPADARPSLVDAALLAADSDSRYDLGPGVRDFIVEHYRDMSAFTQPHDPDTTKTVTALLKDAGVRMPEIQELDQTLRQLIVQENLYRLTAPNLRAALDTTGEVSLDQVRENEAVYGFCRANPRDYLTAVEQDDDTPNTVRTPETLASVLTDVADEWDEGQLERLLANAASSSTLQRLADAPASTWPALAAAGLFRSTLANLKAYRAETGGIDQSLAKLLVEAGAIETNDDEAGEEHAKEEAALALVNAGETIREAANRVSLVRSLKLEAPLPVSQIEPEASELLALLLEHGMVEDDAASFSRFRDAGWAALEPAIHASNHFEEFMTPDLVQGVVADLLESPEFRNRFGHPIVEKLDEFIPEDDGHAFAAAARYAIGHELPLPLDQIRRVATTNPTEPALTLELLRTAESAPTADEIVDTLAELDEPYSHLSTREKTTFTVPDDDAHRTIFQILKDAGVLSEFRKKRGQDARRVKLA